MNQIQFINIDFQNHFQYLNNEVLLNKQSKIIEDEVISSAEIEGEELNRDSVRASIRRKLGLERYTENRLDSHESGVIDILIDANTNYKDELIIEKIFGWHNALFPTGYSGLHKIVVAQYRGKEPMEVVSTLKGRDIVYYVAPDRDILEKEMTNFLNWFNTTPDTIAKSAIAHLWFLIIHPLDDGNGRIARTITDFILSRIEKSNISKLYSMSMFINKDKKSYYDVLENITGYKIKQTDPMDITIWVEWFIKTLILSLENAEDSLKFIHQKVIFWDKHRNSELNARQIKALNKVLDIGIENFGSINRKKYMAIAKMKSTATTTATRDLNELIEKGCIVKDASTSGKGTKYIVLI